MTRKTATLVLDDGSMFHGFSFGFDKAVAGEVVIPKVLPTLRMPGS